MPLFSKSFSYFGTESWVGKELGGTGEKHKGCKEGTL